jgi:Putative peptidoglycan binding domain.
MKITTISEVASLVISSVMIQTAVAGHAVGIGVGPRFGGGGFGGGIFEMLSGGGSSHSKPAFRGGARFSFDARPTFGQPVIVRSPSRIRASLGRITIPPHQRDPVSSIVRQSKANSRSQIASRIQQPSERAGNHIFSRQGASVHHDWDRHSGHYWRGRWWAWNGVAWLGLDEGYYPWDCFPYYAYGYYPYDYYPGYYADVKPYYNNKGVYYGDRSPDPTVTAVQQDLTKLGYYHGSIDGLYGRATRDAVERYQTGHHLAVTGTLTSRILQLLGVSPTGRDEIGSEFGTNCTREIASCVE